MLELIIARCCAKTRIDERMPMLTSQKVIDAINEPASARLRRGRQIDLHRRDLP